MLKHTLWAFGKSEQRTALWITGALFDYGHAIDYGYASRYKG